MNTITYQVTILLTDKVTEAEILAIRDSIANALQARSENVGLTSEDSENAALKFSVTPFSERESIEVNL